MFNKTKSQEESNKILSNHIDLLPKAWHWQYSSGVEYDYDRYTPCSNGDSCCDNDYCRCAVIQNARVTTLDPVKVAAQFTTGMTDELLAYCVDRIVVNSGLLDSDNWEVTVCGGYYGEEIDSVSPSPSIISSLVEKFTLLLDEDYESPFKKIKLALEAEYGYLIPSIKDEEYAVMIEEVSPSVISLGNDDYMRKMSKKTLEFYAEYALPRGVCITSGPRHRLIDGYHRVTAALQNKLNTIKIISLVKVS